MRLAVAVAAWALLSSFPQGRLYRLERDDSELVALRAEGTLKAPAWAVRDVLLRAFESERLSPYLAHRKVLHAEGCQEGARDLPGCKKVWVYERYAPPLMAARDYAFRMEVVTDDVENGGDFELRWAIDESRGAPPDGATHMVRNTGGWEISPAGAGGSRFRYHIDIDPGGSVPAWIVNVANKSQVPSVIAAVEDEAQKLVVRTARSAGRP